MACPLPSPPDLQALDEPLPSPPDLQALDEPLPSPPDLQALDEFIKDTEDLVSIKLDQHRNQIITADLCITAGTLCIAVITSIFGIFGVCVCGGGGAGMTGQDRMGYRGG